MKHLRDKMKNYIMTLAIVILTWSGSINAKELSMEGCQEIRYALIKAASIDDDWELLEEVMNIELLSEEMLDNEFALAEVTAYCKQFEILMKVHEVKEDSIEWNEFIDMLSAGE